MPHLMPTGPSVVLDLIRSGVATTRTELLHQLGWSRITLARRLEELLSTAIIVVAGQRDSGGGRPAETFAVNRDAGILLAIDIGGSHTRVGVTDLVSTVLLEDEAEIGFSESPDEVFSWAVQVLDYLLTKLGKSRADVRGVGVGVPGPVDSHTGRLSAPQHNPLWQDVLVAEHLPIDLRSLVAVDRDVNIMAIGESRLAWPEYQDLTVIKAGLGIGCGLVLDGRIYRGARGGAGDFGHQHRHGDTPCICGRTGCLEAVASGYAIRRELTCRGYTVTSSADIVALAASGNTDAAELLVEAGREIGAALADVVGILNPAAVLIGGNLADTGPVFIDAIRGALFATATEFSRRGLVVAPSRLGHKAGVLGASQIAQDVLFSAERVDAVIRTGGTSLPAAGGNTFTTLVQ